VTLPGGDTVAFKTATLRAIADAGFVLAAGIGNRASDVQAYAAAGLAPDRTFIEASEYADEVQAEVAAGRAVGFTSYDDLKTAHLATLPQL
jgi:phosphatidate phosphatase PAH1